MSSRRRTTVASLRRGVAPRSGGAKAKEDGGRVSCGADTASPAAFTEVPEGTKEIRCSAGATPLQHRNSTGTVPTAVYGS